MEDFYGFLQSYNLDQFYLPDMPPLYYAMSSAEDMDNWPDAWKELDTTKYVDIIE